MKLFNVSGEMFDEGKGIPTHDIEFNSAPAIELADAKTTKEIFDLRLKHGHDQAELDKQLEKRDDTELQKARDKVYNTHLSSLRQYSQTAYRFGDYVMKFSLVPSTAAQKQMEAETVSEKHDSDVLHRWLRDFHANNDAEYLFQVQLLESLEDQPVEYAGTEWDAEKYPFQTVAVLKIPRQESFSYERKAYWEDHLRVDPWLGLKSWQPLGSPNRLRRIVYPRSSALRRELNGRKEIPVKDINEIP